MTWFNTTPAPPWFVEAGRWLGTAEVAGPKSNPAILSWAKALGGWIASFYKDDSVAWCGLFQAHCIGVTLKAEKLPANPLGARNWATFGIPCHPTTGAILVFERPGGGHVGQYVAETADAYLVRGGNQSDKVCEEWIARARCIAVRWPSTYPKPTTGAMLVARRPGGKLSVNEA